MLDEIIGKEITDIYTVGYIDVKWSNSKIKNDNGRVERTAQWILGYFNIGG